MIQIDRQKTYDSHGYKFKNFVCLSDEEKIMVLHWRNHERVRNMMVNKDIISEESHLRFIETLNKREDCYYWLVFTPEGIPVGVVDLLHVDQSKDEGEIGYYINPIEAGIGFEFMIECNYFVYGIIKLGNNLVTVNVNNKEILMFTRYIGGTFEGMERIGDECFYVNKHANGDYILRNYSKFSLIDYARFVKRNKNNKK